MTGFGFQLVLEPVAFRKKRQCGEWSDVAVREEALRGAQRRGNPERIQETPGRTVLGYLYPFGMVTLCFVRNASTERWALGCLGLAGVAAVAIVFLLIPIAILFILSKTPSQSGALRLRRQSGAGSVRMPEFPQPGMCLVTRVNEAG